MPCRCDGDYGPSVSMAAKHELDRLTDLLCRSCRILEDDEENPLDDPEISKWWEAHKASDRIRLEEERKEKVRLKAIQTGLAKLTDEERRALGLRR